MNRFQKKKQKWPTTIFKVFYIPGHWETQIKITLRHHLAPIRRAVTNSVTNGEAVGKKITLHIVGVQISTLIMEIHREIPQKVQNSATLWPRCSSPGNILRELHILLKEIFVCLFKNIFFNF